MSEAEAVWLFGELVGCWCVGWTVGFILKFITQVTEKI